MFKLEPIGPTLLSSDVIWDEKGYSRISYIYVTFDDHGIKSIQFIYFHEGVHVESQKHGYPGGEHTRRVSFAKIFSFFLFPLICSYKSHICLHGLQILFLYSSSLHYKVFFLGYVMMKSRQIYTGEIGKRWIFDCVEWRSLSKSYHVFDISH